jgi:ClpA/ClpB-like protein
MFERYTEGARRVIFFARFEASQYGSPAIEPEHMLLGLLKEYPSLLEGQLSHDSVANLRTVIEPHLKKGQRFPTSVEVPLSKESQNVLWHAYEEAGRLSHDYIGPEHILFGIFTEQTCPASRFLREHGLKVFVPREEYPRRPTGESVRNTIPGKSLDWCCEDFRTRLYQTDGRQDGLGILVLFRSRIPPMFVLEYRRPNRKEPEPVAEDGIRLKFCPWCGRDLIEQYGSGLPPFHSANPE